MNRRPSQSRSSFISFPRSIPRISKPRSPATDFLSPGHRAAGQVCSGFLLLLLLAALAIIPNDQSICTGCARHRADSENGFGAGRIYAAAHFRSQGRVLARINRASVLRCKTKILTWWCSPETWFLPAGTPQPLYTLIEMLHELKPGVPIYMIPGRQRPASHVDELYTAKAAVRSPWVLGARRGAQLLSAPVRIERDGHLAVADNQRAKPVWTWIRCRRSLSEIPRRCPTATKCHRADRYNLQWLTETRDARTR